MTDYLIRFSNDLSDSTGHVHRVCQGEVLISAPENRDQAIEQAKRRFAEAEGVADWSQRARIIECEAPSEPGG